MHRPRSRSHARRQAQARTPPADRAAPARAHRAHARVVPDRARGDPALRADALARLVGRGLDRRLRAAAGAAPVPPRALHRHQPARHRGDLPPPVHPRGRLGRPRRHRAGGDPAGRGAGGPDADRAHGLRRRQADRRDRVRARQPELREGLPRGVSAPRGLGHRLRLDHGQGGARGAQPRGRADVLGVPAHDAQPDLGLSPARARERRA